MEPITEKRTESGRRSGEERGERPQIAAEEGQARADDFAWRLQTRRAEGNSRSAATVDDAGLFDEARIAVAIDADALLIDRAVGERAFAERVARALGLVGLRGSPQRPLDSAPAHAPRVEGSAPALSGEKAEVPEVAEIVNEPDKKAKVEEGEDEAPDTRAGEVAVTTALTPGDHHVFAAEVVAVPRATLDASVFAGIVNYALLVKDAGFGAEFRMGLSLKRPGDASLRIRSLGGGRIAVAARGEEPFLETEIDSLRSLMAERGLELVFEVQPTT